MAASTHAADDQIAHSKRKPTETATSRASFPDGIRYIDLFCGIGGFRFAAEAAAKRVRLKMQCVFSSDIDASCRQAYAATASRRHHASGWRASPNLLVEACLVNLIATTNLCVTKTSNGIYSLSASSDRGERRFTMPSHLLSRLVMRSMMKQSEQLFDCLVRILTRT
jgi:hypothetical protein